MIHHISIDIETYSSVDITKSGLYKYVQSDDFEILLFAYSLNNAPVCIVDLTAGGVIPEEIRKMMFSNNCILHAYNAAFEWYCLSKYFCLTLLDYLAATICETHCVKSGNSGLLQI